MMPLEIFPNFYSHFSDAHSIVQTQEASYWIFNHAAHLQKRTPVKAEF